MYKYVYLLSETHGECRLLYGHVFELFLFSFIKFYTCILSYKRF